MDSPEAPEAPQEPSLRLFCLQISSKITLGLIDASERGVSTQVSGECVSLSVTQGLINCDAGLGLVFLLDFTLKVFKSQINNRDIVKRNDMI